MMDSGWLVILPHISLAAGGILIFCAGAFMRRRASDIIPVLAFASAACAGVSSAWIDPGGPGFLGMLDGGGFSRFFAVIFSLITLMTLVFSHHYARDRGFAGDEFYGVLLFAALGMILVAGASHWLIFFLGLELLSLSLYVLIAARKNDPASNEAALKYFVMGSVAGGFLTFGIAVLYAVTGKMDISAGLGSTMTADNRAGLLLGLSLVMVGIGFKISLVPFHLWTPDVYQGAPAPVTAFLSTGSKVAVFAALLRFSLCSHEAVWAYMAPLFWGLAALTMIVGNVTALAQTHLKRLLAYSSIAQMGYVLMALLAVKHGGASAVVFYLAVYALMDLGAFGAVAVLSGEDRERDDLEDYRGMGYVHPWRAGLLAVCLFSLAGLPPTAGFIGKFLLFHAAIQAGYVALALVGILAAIVSVYYYLRVMGILYMRTGEYGIVPRTGILGDGAGMVILALLLLLGIVPSPLLTAISNIVASLSH